MIFKALYVADGYVQHQALPTNAAALAGREAVVTYFSKRIEAFPDLVVTSDISLTAGDLICANLIYSGTQCVEAAWEQELERRAMEIDSGAVKLEPWSKLRQELDGIVRGS